MQTTSRHVFEDQEEGQAVGDVLLVRDDVAVVTLRMQRGLARGGAEPPLKAVSRRDFDREKRVVARSFRPPYDALCAVSKTTICMSTRDFARHPLH